MWGHPVTAVAGIRGSIVAVFDPAGAAGVDQHSTYASDPLGRVQRSNMFFLQVVFGDTVAAEKIGHWLFNRHQKVNGVVPDSGEPYVANVPETLLWVYVTGWHGALECFQRFAPKSERLNAGEIDQFYRESLITADLLGIPPQYVPSDSIEVQDYLREQGKTLIRPTNEMRRLVEFFLRPPLAPAWPLLAINPFLKMVTYSALSTLPDEWLDLIEVERHRRRWAINDAVVKAALGAAYSSDLLDSFLVLAGPEAWGYRHNALRRNSFSEPVPYEFKQGEMLQQRRAGG
ncbi:oxygenase MpaB family protein [Gordonia malaquae]